MNFNTVPGKRNIEQTFEKMYILLKWLKCHSGRQKCTKIVAARLD